MELSRYELLMLAVPEITQDEAKTIERQVESLVKTYKGAMISFERWGKYRLAFPVNRNDYGVYFLTRFEVGEAKQALLNEIRLLFAIKLNDVVLRNMVTALADDQSLDYQRPKSLEEAPSCDVDMMFKEKNDNRYNAHSDKSFGDQDDVDDE
jgi:small subunit ribosomal protein S6